jgi:hypothetical protein
MRVGVPCVRWYRSPAGWLVIIIIGFASPSSRSSFIPHVGWFRSAVTNLYVFVPTIMCVWHCLFCLVSSITVSLRPPLVRVVLSGVSCLNLVGQQARHAPGQAMLRLGPHSTSCAPLPAVPSKPSRSRPPYVAPCPLELIAVSLPTVSLLQCLLYSNARPSLTYPSRNLGATESTVAYYCIPYRKLFRFVPVATVVITDTEMFGPRAHVEHHI